MPYLTGQFAHGHMWMNILGTGIQGHEYYKRHSLCLTLQIWNWITLKPNDSFYVHYYVDLSFRGIIWHLKFCENTLGCLVVVEVPPSFTDSNCLRPRKIEGAVKFLVFQTLQQNYKSPWLSSFKLNRNGLAPVGLSVNTSKHLATDISHLMLLHCRQASQMSLVADRIAHTFKGNEAADMDAKGQVNHQLNEHSW